MGPWVGARGAGYAILMPTQENDSNLAHLDKLLEQAWVGAISRVGDPVQASEAGRYEGWDRKDEN